MAQHLSDRNPKHPYSSMGDLGKLYRIKGDVTEASNFYQLRFKERVGKPGDQAWSSTWSARCHMDAMDLEGAIQTLRPAVELAETTMPRNDVLLQWVRMELGLLLRATGDTDEANRLFAAVLQDLRTLKDRTVFSPQIDQQVLIVCQLSSTGIQPDPQLLESMVAEMRTQPVDAESVQQDKSFYPIFALGLALDAQGRTTEALAAFRSFALSRNYYDYHYLEEPELRVVEVLKSEKKYDEAKLFLEELLLKADKELRQSEKITLTISSRVA